TEGFFKAQHAGVEPAGGVHVVGVQGDVRHADDRRTFDFFGGLSLCADDEKGSRHQEEEENYSFERELHDRGCCAAVGGMSSRAAQMPLITPCHSERSRGTWCLRAASTHLS